MKSKILFLCVLLVIVEILIVLLFYLIKVNVVVFYNSIFINVNLNVIIVLDYIVFSWIGDLIII